MKTRGRYVVLSLCLAGCSVNDARTAHVAQRNLLGMSELQLETCAGVPDERTSVGGTDIFTYYATSTSSTSLTIPVVGGIGKSFGGYCHTIVRLDNDRVTGVRYTGEANAFAATDAFCAPTVRGCVYNPPPASDGAPATGAAPVARPEEPG